MATHRVIQLGTKEAFCPVKLQSNSQVTIQPAKVTCDNCKKKQQVTAKTVYPLEVYTDGDHQVAILVRRHGFEYSIHVNHGDAAALVTRTIEGRITHSSQDVRDTIKELESSQSRRLKYKKAVQQWYTWYAMLLKDSGFNRMYSWINRGARS